MLEVGLGKAKFEHLAERGECSAEVSSLHLIGRWLVALADLFNLASSSEPALFSSRETSKMVAPWVSLLTGIKGCTHSYGRLAELVLNALLLLRAGGHAFQESTRT